MLVFTSHNIISYIGFMQVIRADMTCLGFIFPELKAILSYLTFWRQCPRKYDSQIYLPPRLFTRQ